MLITKSRARRIAIFHAEGFLDSLPCLMSTISVLTRHGYNVDVFMVEDDRFLKPDLENPNVLIEWMPGGERNSRLLIHSSHLPRWIAYARRKCRNKQYSYFIGVDPLGLILATILGHMQRVPVVYYSLELYISDESRRSTKILKIFERFCNKKAQFTIIQDMERANLLSKDNGIPISKIFLVPNSRLGKGTKCSSNFLREKFGIAPHQKIILQMGAIARWTMSLDLAMAVRTWPEDWTLVLHTRETPSESAYVEQIHKVADGKKVILSMEPVPYTLLDELVSSADIGVALYKPNPLGLCATNLRAVGLSSGKIAQYLRCGLPIITSNFTSLRNMTEQYGCGLTVDTADQVSDAVHRIFSNYNAFSAGAINCYNEKYDFEQAFSVVLNRLQNI